MVDSPAGPKDDDLQRMMDRFNVPAKGGGRSGRTATLINMWRVQGGKVAPKAMPDGGGGAVQAPAPPMVCGRWSTRVYGHDRMRVTIYAHGIACCMWHAPLYLHHAQGHGQLDAVSRIPSGKVQAARAAFQSMGVRRELMTVVCCCTFMHRRAGRTMLVGQMARQGRLERSTARGCCQRVEWGA